MKKRKVNKIIILVIVLLILLLVFSIFINYKSYRQYERQIEEIDDLKDVLTIKNDEIEQINLEKNNLNDIVYDLNSSLYAVSDMYNDSQKELSELTHDYDEIQEEVKMTILEIETYQSEIKESMQWFSKNSVLGDSNSEERVIRKLDRNCYKINPDSCEIKLGCFYLVNYEFLDLEYKNDIDISGEEDKLISIYDFLENKGGDCEDYSLFYKAEFNYVLELCKDKTIEMDAWYIGDEEKKYWINFEKTWYLDDVTVVEFVDYKYPSIICGMLYDINVDNIDGHCVVAFTKEKIENYRDLESKLDEAIIIEPQDGSYLGELNKESSGIYLLNTFVNYDEDIDSYIWAVITDNDYYLYDFEENYWMSYNSFYDDLDDRKDILEIIVDMN